MHNIPIIIINFGFSYKIYDSNYVIFKADINQDRPNKI